MPSSEPSSGLHILVVDDNSDCAVTTAMLLRAYGHFVEIAPDGAAALASVASRRPDVVLLDISLPGMDGWELATRIRHLADGTLLIAITGWDREEDRHHSAESGIDLLTKPVEPEQLRSLLASVQAH